MDLNALNYVPRPCLAQNEFNIGKKECCGLESIYLFYVCDVYEITRFFFFFEYRDSQITLQMMQSVCSLFHPISKFGRRLKINAYQQQVCLRTTRIWLPMAFQFWGFGYEVTIYTKHGIPSHKKAC